MPYALCPQRGVRGARAGAFLGTGPEWVACGP